jgi:hypothetical protein
MATYTLNPNADHAADDLGSNWNLSTGSDMWAILDDTSGHRIYSNDGATGYDFRVGFETFTLGATETIDSVQCCITAHTGNTRSETAVVRNNIQDGSNSGLFTDLHTVTVNGGSPATYCGTATTTSDGGSTAWTQGDIDAIRMDGEVYSFSGGTPNVNIYQAYITVVTTIPVAATPTYPSDDNVILKNGLIELKNGLTIIK